MPFKRPSIDDYMTIPQVVKFLGVPKATVYYWIKFSTLPADFLGETKVMLRKDVMTMKGYLEKGEAT